MNKNQKEKNSLSGKENDFIRISKPLSQLNLTYEYFIHLAKPSPTKSFNLYKMFILRNGKFFKAKTLV